MCNYGGFILVIGEALGLLALALILAGFAGAVWLALVTLAHAGHAWLALVVALVALTLLWCWPPSRVRRLEQEAPATVDHVEGLCQPGFCEHCGSLRPGLICPLCGESVLDGKAG